MKNKKNNPDNIIELDKVKDSIVNTENSNSIGNGNGMDNSKDSIVYKKRTRGRGGNGNFPNSRAGLITTDEDRRLVSKLLTEVYTEYVKPRVKSDDELKERLDDYFRRCAERGQIPTVEEMVMSTGLTYSTWCDIDLGKNRGFSTETSFIIKKAREYLKTFDAKLVVSGKLNFLAYCFRAKNYYGMSDKQEITLTPAQNAEQDLSAEDIRKMLDDGRTVETGFADDGQD